MFIKLSHLVFCCTLLCIFVRNVSRKGISSGLRMKRFKRILTDPETSDFAYEPETIFLNVKFSLRDGEVPNAKIRSQKLVYAVLYLPILKCFLWSHRSTNFRNVYSRTFVGKQHRTFSKVTVVKKRNQCWNIHFSDGLNFVASFILSKVRFSVKLSTFIHFKAFGAITRMCRNAVGSGRLLRT